MRFGAAGADPKRVVEVLKANPGIRDDYSPDELAERIYAPIYFRRPFGEGSFDADAVASGLELALNGIPRPSA